MPHSTPQRRRLRLTPLLIALSSLSLTSCADTRISGFCPATVWPSKCVVDWYASQQTPQCLDEWMDKVSRQQRVIDAACKK